MGKMIDYIHNPSVAMRLKELLLAEMEHNSREITKRTDWCSGDREKCLHAISGEQKRIGNASFSNAKNSVKGESAVKNCYPNTSVKAPDIITLKIGNDLQLIELKYAQKIGNTGMFSSENFIKKISDKFLKTIALMTDESVTPLRIIIVLEEQLQVCIARLREATLEQNASAESSYSSDGRKYKYCLCTGKDLQKIVDEAPNITEVDDAYIFDL